MERFVSCTHAFSDIDKLNKFKRHAEYWFYCRFDRQRNRAYSLPSDEELKTFSEWIFHEDSLRTSKEPIEAYPPKNFDHNVKVVCLNYSTNDHVQYFDQLVLRDNVILTPQTSPEEAFKGISKLKNFTIMSN